MYNYMFRPIFCHPQVHSYSLKHYIYIYIFLPQQVLKTNSEPENDQKWVKIYNYI